MFASLQPSLADTPSWVYSLLAFLILIAIQATRPLIIPIKRLLYMPAFFFILSIAIIWYAIPLTRTNFLCWSAGLLFGAGAGWWQIRALRVKAIRHTKNIYVPGTWSLLIAVIIIIFIKFYVHWRFSYIDPRLLQIPLYARLFMVLYGFLMGMFVGRIGHAFYRVRYGPFIEMDEIKVKRA